MEKLYKLKWMTVDKRDEILVLLDNDGHIITMLNSKNGFVLRKVGDNLFIFMKDRDNNSSGHFITLLTMNIDISAVQDDIQPF